MSPGILLPRRPSVSDLHDLRQVFRQEAGKRSRPLILVHMPEFMSQQSSLSLMSAAKQHRIAKRQPQSVGTQEPGYQCGPAEIRIVWSRKAVDTHDPDPIGTAYPDRACHQYFRPVGYPPTNEYVMRDRFHPRDGPRQQHRQIDQRHRS